MADNKQLQTKSHEEEIDLGQLFSLLGKGFSNFFKFIGSILKTILDWILNLVLFIRSNFIKLTIGAVLGLIVGGIFQYGYKTPTYTSSMMVEPNFGSAVQLYKNIDLYQSLIEQEDLERLAISLNISKEESKSISSIKVKPYSNKNQTILSYKNFIEDLDSTTVKLVNYESYAEKQPIESFRFHIVTITSKDKFIFSKLEKPIISSIIQNIYYDKVKSTAYSNLISRKVALEGSMVQLDSLRSLYNKVILAESKKVTSGTNIFMSSTGINNKEVIVFDKYMNMNQMLIDVNKKLTQENEVINVVSSFNSIGMKIGGWYRNMALRGLIFGFLLVLIILTLRNLNKLLTGYEKKSTV